MVAEDGSTSVKLMYGRIPTFHGLYDEDAISWMEQFKMVADSNHWTEAIHIIQIYSHLEGTAKKWFEELPAEDKKDWMKICRGFLHAFQEGSRVIRLQKAREARQIEGETV